MKLELPDDVHRTAGLLRDGLNDKAIGRIDAVSQRTVRRRVAILMAALGAKTRFQAGYLLCLLDAGERAAAVHRSPRPL